MALMNTIINYVVFSKFDAKTIYYGNCMTDRLFCSNFCFFDCKLDFGKMNTHAK